MIGMTCSRQQHPSTSSLCQTLPTPDWYLESKPRRLLGKKKNLVPAKRKRSKLSYLNGRRVSLDDSGRLDRRSHLDRAPDIWVLGPRETPPASAAWSTPGWGVRSPGSAPHAVAHATGRRRQTAPERLQWEP